MQNLRCALTVTETGGMVLGKSMKSPVKNMTRRDLLKEMVSKDTMKQVMSAWYGFSRPFSEEKAEQKKKDSLLQTIKKADMKYMNNNGKEG
jgi:hypothetical protein